MKICFITPTMAIGGYERFLLNLMNGLIEDDIYIVAINAVGGYKDEFVKRGKIIDLKSNRTRESIIKLKNALKSIDPEIVYVSFTSFVFVVIIKKILNLKYKIVVGEHLITWPKNCIHKTILKYCYKNSDSIIAVSKFTKEKLCENVGIKGELVKIIYNPIIKEDKNKEMKKIEHRWIGTNYNIIILIGRLEKDKGFQYLIEAFSKIDNKEDKRILILGEGSYRERLYEIVKAKNLTEYIEFIGFVNDPNLYLKWADNIFILSDYETFGNIAVEALYNECNIITYKGIGGPEEILNNGEFGVIMKDRNISSIVDELNKLEYKKSDKRLRQRAMEFTQEKSIDEYKYIFASLIND
ncbi:glycosyltransferase [Clostridium tertium]